MITDLADTCQEPDSADPSMVCRAAAAADQRCLAHLTPAGRTAYLATLAPEVDIDARGVTFTRDLLTELLNAFYDPRGIPQVGTAEFGDATFTGDALFVGVTFTGDARFVGATFTGDAEFNRATFKGNAEFDRVTFTGDARFDRATFTGNAEFNRATFTADAEFTQATFTGDAEFGDATFTGDAQFTQATITGDVDFRSTTFAGDARFVHVTFSRNAGFVHVTFTGDTEFHGATFTGDARFYGVTFTGDAHFYGVTFTGEAGFGAAVVLGELVVEAIGGRLSAVGLRGGGRVSLRLRAAEVDLSNAVLAGPVSVHGLQHPIDWTHDAAFRDDAGQVSPVRVVSLRGLDALSVMLTDVDLSGCQFAGLQRADQVVLDGRCVFADGPGGRRRVLAEEHHWRASQAAQAGGRTTETSGWIPLPHRPGQRTEVVGPERLEVLYRQLRKALEDAKNEPGAADFYYGEMEMRRAATTRRPERWLLWLYWALSGYGLRARRAAAWLTLLAVLSIAGMTWFGFPQTAKDQNATGTVTTPAGRQPVNLTIRQSDPVKPVADRMEKATEVTLNAVIFRNPDADLTTAGRYLNIITRILGPILLGLTILAIRNQVKR